MFAKSFFTILPLFSAISTLVRADVVPTSPDGSTVLKVGQTAKALWTKDSQGNWTDVTVKLMTGDNFNMVEVTTLAENVDGTTTDSLEWTVPDVMPNSKIYFLQFSPDAVTTPEWTTRFTIAAADGSTTDPTNSTQPGGASIAWGTGKLVSGGNTTSVSSPSSNSTSAETSSSVTSAVSSTSSSSTSASMMTTSVRAVAAATDSASSAMSSAASNSASAPSASTPTSGATTVQVAGGAVALVGFVAGFMAM